MKKMLIAALLLISAFLVSCSSSAKSSTQQQIEQPVTFSSFTFEEYKFLSDVTYHYKTLFKDPYYLTPIVENKNDFIAYDLIKSINTTTNEKESHVVIKRISENNYTVTINSNVVAYKTFKEASTALQIYFDSFLGS